MNSPIYCKENERILRAFQDRRHQAQIVSLFYQHLMQKLYQFSTASFRRKKQGHASYLPGEASIALVSKLDKDITRGENCRPAFLPSPQAAWSQAHCTLMTPISQPSVIRCCSINIYPNHSALFAGLCACVCVHARVCAHSCTHTYSPILSF